MKDKQVQKNRIDSKKILARSDLFLQSRSLRNLFCMGHCAPAIMGTLLEAGGASHNSLVKLAAANPGGIGLSGAECGAVTSPIMALGLEYGDEADGDGLSTVVDLGQRYIEAFAERNGSLFCRDIQKNGPEPVPCMKAVAGALPMAKNVLLNGGKHGSQTERQAANGILLEAFHRDRFHCAHQVLRALDNRVDIAEETLHASLGFIGGTVLLGHTCSALVGGVLALGLVLGEIENSYLQVVKMLWTVSRGGDGMAPHVNKFNRAIVAGRELISRFEQEFGNTRCSALTEADFADAESVQSFIGRQGLARCRSMAETVVKQVNAILDEGEHRQKEGAAT